MGVDPPDKQGHLFNSNDSKQKNKVVQSNPLPSSSSSFSSSSSSKITTNTSTTNTNTSITHELTSTTQNPTSITHNTSITTNTNPSNNTNLYRSSYRGAVAPPWSGEQKQLVSEFISKNFELFSFNKSGNVKWKNLQSEVDKLVRDLNSIGREIADKRAKEVLKDSYNSELIRRNKLSKQDEDSQDEDDDEEIVDNLMNTSNTLPLETVTQPSLGSENPRKRKNTDDININNRIENSSPNNFNLNNHMNNTNRFNFSQSINENIPSNPPITNTDSSSQTNNSNNEEEIHVVDEFIIIETEGVKRSKMEKKMRSQIPPQAPFSKSNNHYHANNKDMRNKRKPFKEINRDTNVFSSNRFAGSRFGPGVSSGGSKINHFSNKGPKRNRFKGANHKNNHTVPNLVNTNNRDNNRTYSQVVRDNLRPNNQNRRVSKIHPKQIPKVRHNKGIGDLRGRNKETFQTKNSLPKRKFNKEDNAKVRLEYFLNSTRPLKRCYRFDPVPWIPFFEIDSEVAKLLDPLSSELRRSNITQIRYKEINNEANRIILAALHTAKSYDFQRIDEDGWKDRRQRKSVFKLKSTTRLIDKVKKAWASRKENTINGQLTIEDKNSGLAKARALAKKKNLSSIPQLINKLEDEIETQKFYVEKQNKASEEQKIRYLFDKTNSFKVIRSKGRTKNTDLSEAKALEFYKSLHAKKTVDETFYLDEWYDYMKQKPIVKNLSELEKIIDEVIKRSPPWKTPGPNKIDCAAYKRFKSVKEFLISKVKAVFAGFIYTDKTEHIANGFLLPKTKNKDELKEPKNYRLINCINSDIKIMSAVAHQFIFYNTIEHLQPNQQAGRKEVQSTLQAMNLNAAIIAQNNDIVSTVYLDLRKAFDSITHQAVNKIIEAIPIPGPIKNYLIHMIANSSFKIVNIERDHSIDKDQRTIKVNRGIMQGDACAPFIFMLGIDEETELSNKYVNMDISNIDLQIIEDSLDNSINKSTYTLEHQIALATVPIPQDLNNWPEVEATLDLEGNRERIQNEEIQRKSQISDEIVLNKKVYEVPHEINHIAFVDDYKLFATDYKTLEDLKNTFIRTASQLGLSINEGKSAVEPSNTEYIDKVFSDIDNVSSAYKYLGIYEKNHKISVKDLEKQLDEKVIQLTTEIFSSCLSIGQKVRYFNMSVIPSVGYVILHAANQANIGHLQGMCRRLDKTIRSVLSGTIEGASEIDVRHRTQSIAKLYCTYEQGGLGLKLLQVEAHKQIVFNALYILLKPEMQRVKNMYIKKCNNNLINPIAKMGRVFSKYDISFSYKNKVITINSADFSDFKAAKDYVAKIIEDKTHQEIFNKWSQKMTYAKLYRELNLSMPWLKKANVNQKTFNIICAAQQNNLPGMYNIIGGKAQPSQKCKFCDQPLTSDHLTSKCTNDKSLQLYRSRHDRAMTNLTNSLLSLRGKRYLNVNQLREKKENEEISNGWCIVFDRPVTENNSQLTHNRADLVLINKKLKKCIIVEFCITQASNIVLQRNLKLAKYQINGQNLVTPQSVPTITPGHNIKKFYEIKYGYNTVIVPIVFGVYGELHPLTEKDTAPLKMVTKQIDKILENISRNVVLGTEYIIRNFLSSLLSDKKDQSN
uniref:Reverse transcriptase domain-containing protein n=1 Tax=Parastrongyloides trichosuri TaxID=131310 RepID=A0A0N4ZXT3_PARTI